MAQLLSSQMSGVIPVEISNQVIADITRGSAAMQLSRIEPMTAPTKTVPIMTNGAGAYWVGEGERIQTEAATWIFPQLTAKKLGIIIPVSKDVLNDSTIDVFAQMQPQIAEQFAAALDSAVFFGTNSPWGVGKSILELAEGASNEVVEGAVVSQKLDGDISDAMALVEDDGYDVNGFVSSMGIKNVLRKFRDNDGAPIFSDMKEDVPAQIYGAQLSYVRNGAFDATKSKLIAGNFNYNLIGVLQGIEYEILKEATLQGTLGSDGKPLSLAEQDMIGLKTTMRIAYLCVKANAFANLKPKTV